MIRQLFFCFFLALVACHPAVAAPITQTFTVTWDPPTTRADGSALAITDLSGYEINYIVDSGQSNTVKITGGSTKSSTIALNLAARTTPYVISFAIAAVDSTGLKSTLSPVVNVSATIQYALPSPPGNQKIDLKCANGICSMTIQPAQ